MKRVDLIKAIEGSGCVLVRHGVGMIGIATQPQVSPSQCLATVKSRSLSLGESFAC